MMKNLNEINIFKKFAKIYPISLKIGSVKKNIEPKPDISCKTINNDVKTFELVQIIDTSLATTINSPLKLIDSFNNTLEKMGKIASEDLVILTKGDSMGSLGGTNAMKILQVAHVV